MFDDWIIKSFIFMYFMLMRLVYFIGCAHTIFMCLTGGARRGGHLPIFPRNAFSPFTPKQKSFFALFLPPSPNQIDSIQFKLRSFPQLPTPPPPPPHSKSWRCHSLYIEMNNSNGWSIDFRCANLLSRISCWEAHSLGKKFFLIRIPPNKGSLSKFDPASQL